MRSSPVPVSRPLYRVFSAFRCELARFLHKNDRQVQAAGLTPQQFSLLLLLGAADEDGIGVGEAAQGLFLAHNSMVGLSKRAEQAGLLRRVSQGGRRQGTRLQLTSEGARRLAEVTGVLIADLAGERLQLIEKLTRWNAVLDTRGLPPFPGGHAAAGYRVRRAGAQDQPLVWKLLQLYLDERSGHLDVVPGEGGEYSYPDFDRYWQPGGHAAYLLQAGSRPAGFALVRCLTAAPAWHRLDEFGVLRAYRGQGAGALLASEVLHAHPGRWTVPHHSRNLFAQHFWDHVLPRHASAPPVHAPDGTRPELWEFQLSVPARPQAQ